MKTGWFKCVWLIWLAAGSAAAFDRLEIEASLDHDSRSISGVVRVRFESADSSLRDVRFRLYPNRFCEESDSAACGIIVDSVFVGGRDLSTMAVVDGTDMWLSLPEPCPAGSSLAVDLYFVTSVPEQPGRFGFFDGQFTLESWHPMPAPWRDTGWVKIDYGPNTEPVADFYDITATIRLSDSLQLIGPGIRETESRGGAQVVKLALCPAQELPLVVATGYRCDETDCRRVAVKTYYRPEQVFALDTARRTVCQTLQYMADNVMPCPFPELVVVMGGLTRSGALELPRMVLMPERKSGLFTRTYQVTLIHETVHQWFYGTLNSDQATDPWLDESVTEYFTGKINRWMADDDADFLSLYGFTASYCGVHRVPSHFLFDLEPIDRPAHEYGHGEFFGAVYCKGALVLRTLTGIMGKDKENRFWREYVDRFRFARPTRAGLVQVAADYMPTADTAAVSALVSTVAALDFAVRFVAVEPVAAEPESAADSTAPGQTLRATVEYAARQPLGFPVDLRIEYQDGFVRDTVINPAPGTHRLTFDYYVAPVCVTIDPEYKYAIDVNLLNNSDRLSGRKGTGLRLCSRVMFLVQSLFSALWGM